MRRFALFAATALGVALAAGPAAAKDWTKVTIATEGAYEPWNYVLPDGKLAGFEIDLAHDLCGKMKVECTIVQNDWDGMIPALNAGKFDAIMAGMSVTAKRLQVIDFSSSYASGPSGFMVPKASDLAKLPGTGEILNLSGDAAKSKPIIDGMRALLKGKTIGVQVATIQANFIHHYFDDVATVQEYKTTEQHDLDLMAGRVDADFAEVSYFLTTLSKPDAKDLMLAGAEVRGGPDLGEGTAVGIRKNEPELKALFDHAIAAEIADGSLKTLQGKWFKLDMMPPELMGAPAQGRSPVIDLTLFGFGPTGWGAAMGRATLMTLAVTVVAMLIGAAGGAAIAAAKLSGRRSLRTVADAYTTVLRGVPELLVIYLVYFGGSAVVTKAASVLGVQGFLGLPSFLAGSLACGLTSAAYQAEVYRGAALAVPRGQAEAARALGMDAALRFRRILVPQIVAVALPGLGNVWQLALKESALISVTGLVELLRQSQIGAGSTHQPFSFYVAAGLLYLVLTTASTLLFGQAEWRMTRSARRL